MGTFCHIEPFQDRKWKKESHYPTSHQECRMTTIKRSCQELYITPRMARRVQRHTDHSPTCQDRL
eukprot:m.67286 g.67286  ORF g.67286 m.67286 type:complete len:65 (-) comp8424_c0_seq2:1258-1452(-)